MPKNFNSRDIKIVQIKLVELVLCDCKIQRLAETMVLKKYLFIMKTII